jgi:hypothetical protein
MGHWSFSKYSTDYEDKDGEEVNKSTPSLKCEEEPAKDYGEPDKDDEEPTDDEKEEVPQAVEEEDKEEVEK